MKSSTTAAFHPVHASRAFTRPPAPDIQQNSTSARKMTASSSTQRPGKVDWPQSVRQYVQRAFKAEHAIPGIDREDMEEKLKQTITQANERDALNTIDWDHLPLPQQMIQCERDGTTGFSMEGVLFPKKRKSSDLYDPHEDDNRPPSTKQKTNNRNPLEDRVASLAPAFGGRLNLQQKPLDDRSYHKESSKFHTEPVSKRPRRLSNRGHGPATVQPPWVKKVQTPAPIAPEGPVVGRCQDLEKKYFRLTAPPNPDTVRPLPVLERTLELLKRKWKEDNNYSYICDQFKSLRQDLTVQHIKNGFTVHVYEIHARIALEKGDLGEYNQCQTQLRALHSHRLGPYALEFKAYRILYFIHTCNRTDMNEVLADLTPAEMKDPAVKHALDVRSALALGNYHRFFRLYLDAPNMGAYLMDMFVDRERLAALANICKAYRPDVPVRFITEELAFESDPETVQFLGDHQAQGFLEMRGEDNLLHFLSGKAGSTMEAAKNNAFRRVDIKGQI